MPTHSHNIKGIIYRIYNSGVADKIIYLLDEDGQKSSALAKGVKKQNSKKAHSIEIGNYVKANLLGGYSTPIITEISLLNEYSYWKDNLRKITTLQFICEVIDNFAFEENSDKNLFNLFQEILLTKSENTTMILSYFIIKLLDKSGNLPEINFYVNTGNPIIVGEGYFSENNIGYVTKDASSNQNQVNPLIYKSQRFLLNSTLLNCLKLSLEPELTKVMFRIHLSWLTQVLGKKLKSLDILLKVL